jgi:hypothetical protein
VAWLETSDGLTMIKNAYLFFFNAKKMVIFFKLIKSNFFKIGAA